MNLLTLAMLPREAKALRQTKNAHVYLAQFLGAGKTPYDRSLVIALGILAFPNEPRPQAHPDFPLAIKLLKQLKVARDSQTETKIKGTNYEPAIPSDEARKQNAEYRKKHGYTYIGPRAVGVRLARRGVERRIVSAGQAQLIEI